VPELVDATAPDLLAFRAQLVELGAPEPVVGAVMALVEQMTKANHQLAFRLQAALRQLYRKKSEKISSEQLALFLAQLPAEVAADAQVGADPAPADDEIPPAPPARKKPRGKQPFPPHLRREIKVVPVPESECQCEICGGEKATIGHETQILWEFRPAEFFLVEERREKRACSRCGEGVMTAPASPKPKEGARPGPGLLAQIVTAKYRDAVPLYRQSQIYERSGISLAPSTLGDWVSLAADLVEPIYHLARDQTLGCYLVSLDDTGMPVLDRDHPRGVKRGHLWTYVGDQGRAAFCDYTPDWKGEHPQKVLEAFTGKVLQGDGYAGLDALFARPGAPRRAGCMDHARRRFVVALEAGDARAAVAVSLFKQLYAVERAAREAGDDPAALHARRQRDSRPLVDRLHLVIGKLAPQAVPKSPLGKAVTYAINQWDTLKVFLDDPRVPLSNAQVERHQRRTAIGRKNYLFAGSDEGARRLAILMTLVVNCELAGASTFEYLRDVLERIAAGWPQRRLGELLPHTWLANQRRQEQEADGGTAGTAAVDA
jgi:transposase